MSTSVANSEIVRQAFRLIDKAPITSFAEGSEEAEAAEELYHKALRLCLEESDWSFASQISELSAVTPTAPDYEADDDLPYAMNLPGDCVRMIEMRSTAVRWRVDRGYLRCDSEGPVKIRYTAMIEDESKLSASFATAVASRLAVELVQRWSTTQGRVQRIDQKAERDMIRAKYADRQSAHPVRYDGRDDERDWVTDAQR